MPKGLPTLLLIGAAGLAALATTLTAAPRFGAYKSIAAPKGLLTSTLVTWSPDRRHTFWASGRRRREEIARYALVTFAHQGMSLSAPHLAFRAALKTRPRAWVLLGAAVVTIFSYGGRRFFKFAPQRLGSHAV